MLNFLNTNYFEINRDKIHKLEKNSIYANKLKCINSDIKLAKKARLNSCFELIAISSATAINELYACLSQSENLTATTIASSSLIVAAAALSRPIAKKDNEKIRELKEKRAKIIYELEEEKTRLRNKVRIRKI